MRDRAGWLEQQEVGGMLSMLMLDDVFSSSTSKAAGASGAATVAADAFSQNASAFPLLTQKRMPFLTFPLGHCSSETFFKAKRRVTCPRHARSLLHTLIPVTNFLHFAFQQYRTRTNYFPRAGRQPEEDQKEDAHALANGEEQTGWGHRRETSYPERERTDIIYLELQGSR